jgi:tetratricopeptide (TPR) repeat protein
LSDEIEKLKAEGDKYRSMKVKSAAAEKYYEASTRLKEKGEDAEAIRLLLQAIKLYEEERGARLEEFLEKTAPVLDSLEQPKMAGETYLKSGRQHVQRADHRGAIPLYLKASEAFKRSNLFRDAAESLRAAAEEYVALSELPLAAEHIEKEADARLQINDTIGATRALRDARDLYWKAGRFGESARCLKRAADMQIASGNLREGERNYLQAADDLRKAANESIKEGDHDQATRSLLEASLIYLKAKQPAEASKCHALAAEEELKKEDINAASENFRKATIELLLAGEPEAARNIINNIKNEEVRKTPSLRQSVALVEIFEKGDEEGLNSILREINDFSLVQLCLAFGKLVR